MIRSTCGRLDRAARRLLVLGMLIAFIGTLFMTSVNFRPFNFVPAWFSRIDDREAAWATLTDLGGTHFDDPETRWEVASQISGDERGFAELLRMIVARSKTISPHGVTGMQISPSSYSSNGESWIGTYHVELRFRGQPEPVIVEEMSGVDGWIRDARLNWGLAHGFPVLLWGLLISLIAQVILHMISGRGRGTKKNMG